MIGFCNNISHEDVLLRQGSKKQLDCMASYNRTAKLVTLEPKKPKAAWLPGSY
jgi:hypothetical protein